MASAPAQIPTSFGHELRACLRCRLVKTYDQVSLPFFIFLHSLSKIMSQVCLKYKTVTVFISQFRESGCENCPFFKMEEDHERVVDCTTPNFNGYVCVNSSSKPSSPLNFSMFILFFFFHLIFQQDHFSNGSNSKLGGPLVAHW